MGDEEWKLVNQLMFTDKTDSLANSEEMFNRLLS